MDPISINEKQFILQALKEDQRSDGRNKLESRDISISLHRHKLEASAEVHLGETKYLKERIYILFYFSLLSRVLCITTAEVVSPFGDRPNEGLLEFNILFSPMAGREYYVFRGLETRFMAQDTDLSELETELKRILERSIKESDAIDMEALCLIPGEKVWL